MAGPPPLSQPANWPYNAQVKARNALVSIRRSNAARLWLPPLSTCNNWLPLLFLQSFRHLKSLNLGRKSCPLISIRSFSLSIMLSNPRSWLLAIAIANLLSTPGLVSGQAPPLYQAPYFSVSFLFLQFGVKKIPRTLANFASCALEAGLEPPILHLGRV